MKTVLSPSNDGYSGSASGTSSGSISYVTEVDHYECNVVVQPGANCASVSGGNANARVGNSITVTSQGNPGTRFLGWYVNGGLYSTSESCTFTAQDDITLVADYQQQYTVTFHMYYGGTTSQTVDAGGSATAPAHTVEEGCTFGWNDGINYIYNVQGDVDVYETRTPNNYTISFNSNGGSGVASITAPYGSVLTPPAPPTKVGYTFAGWSPGFPATMPYYNQTLTAQWGGNLCELGYDNVFLLTDWFATSSASMMPNAPASLGGWLYGVGAVVMTGSASDYADAYTFFDRSSHLSTGVHVFAVSPTYSPYTVSCNVWFYKSGGYDPVDNVANNVQHGNASTRVWMFFFDASGNYISGADASGPCLPPSSTGPENFRRIEFDVNIPQNAATATLFFEAVLRNGERAEFSSIRVIDKARNGYAPWQTRFVYTYAEGRTYNQQVDSRTQDGGLNLLNRGQYPTSDGFIFAGWLDDSGSAVGGDSVVSPGSKRLYSTWARCVTITMFSACDAGSFPSGAGVPNVKVGTGAKGAGPVSFAVVEGGVAKLYASAGATGLVFDNFTAVDGAGRPVLPSVPEISDEVVDGEAMKAVSFLVGVGSSDITATAIYSRGVLSVSVGLSTASGGVGQNLVSISPSALTRHFGDAVTFTAAAASGYVFYGWSKSAGTSQDTVFESDSSQYQVTLAEDVTLYAHYARQVNVTVRSLESDGTASQDVGGTVAVSMMGQSVAEPGTAFSVPLGGTVRIVSTAMAESDFRFAGVEFIPSGGGDAVHKDFGADASFEPDGNGTYRVTFKKNLPFVYLACADETETSAVGTKGETTAAYSGGIDGDFAEVSVEDLPSGLATGVPEDARWYKVRQNTTVALAARRSSAADSLEWKDFDDESLPLGASLLSAEVGESGTGQLPVWENTSYVVSDNVLVTTTWGVYPSPTVILVVDPANGGSAMFDGESSDVSQKTFEATLDTETGMYAYQTAKVVALPSPDGGFMFVGWMERRGDGSDGMLVSTSLEYSFKVRSDVTLVALFRADTDAVYKWEGGSANKTLEWSSGVVTVPMPGDPVAVRVDATGYVDPVEVDVGTYSSPDEEPTRQHAVEIYSQSARRIQRMRPERFWRVSVRADVEIDTLVVATNMKEAN